MASPSSDASSSDYRADGRLMRVDIESHGQEAGIGRRVFRLWKVPLPLRRDHIFSDLAMNIAFLTTSLCVLQFMYITRLKDGLTRIPNDPFDGEFWRIDHDNPAIWDNDRQSFIHNALPVPVHSHNDYWQRIPLFEALGSGCISVEADVHLRNSDLLVGHTASNVRSGSTLRSMYLEPLQRMLEAQNVDCTDGQWKGLFNRAPQQTFVLLVDLKSSGPETFAELHAQLQPLRDLDYLTYWNGTERVERPLTVVASGTAPFQSVIALDPPHRDIFWDAKLERLVSIGDNFDTEPVTFGYNRSNSYFASTEFKNAILHDRRWNVSMPVTPQMEDIMASQIEQAKARGLIARYWNTPAQPPNVREIAWRVLLEKQIDILNMDDMGIVRARASGWGRIKKSIYRPD